MSAAGPPQGARPPGGRRRAAPLGGEPASAPAGRGRPPRRQVDGVLLLDKPAGLTSNGALQHVKRLYAAEKAGHTGTLDPLAAGLLPICLGEATKFAQFLLDAPKSYRATVRFGAETTTGDSEGEVGATAPVAFSRADLCAALARFTGPIDQVPPAYAALKHQGRKYYEYARQGIALDVAPRRVVIHALDLLDWQPPDATLALACSKGTYVRALARDLGRALGSAAHLAALTRTATGGFTLGQALGPDRLAAMTPGELDAALLPVEALVTGLPRLELGAADAARFEHGGEVDAPPQAQGACAVFGAGRFLGVAEAGAGRARPRRVVAGARAPGEAARGLPLSA